MFDMDLNSVQRRAAREHCVVVYGAKRKSATTVCPEHCHVTDRNFACNIHSGQRAWKRLDQGQESDATAARGNLARRLCSISAVVDSKLALSVAANEFKTTSEPPPSGSCRAAWKGAQQQSQQCNTTAEKQMRGADRPVETTFAVHVLRGGTPTGVSLNALVKREM